MKIAVFYYKKEDLVFCALPDLSAIQEMERETMIERESWEMVNLIYLLCWIGTSKLDSLGDEADQNRTKIDKDKERKKLLDDSNKLKLIAFSVPNSTWDKLLEQYH